MMFVGGPSFLTTKERKTACESQGNPSAAGMPPLLTTTEGGERRMVRRVVIPDGQEKKDQLRFKSKSFGGRNAAAPNDYRGR
jgi:hypothetical protein